MQNPVAKHTKAYNKSTVQRDRKNDYKRQAKHRNAN